MAPELRKSIWWGLHPELPFEFYLRMMATIKANNPDLKIKAFTAVEIDYFARLSGLSVEEVISELKRLGLDSTPGGGAEIFASDIRNKICPEKSPQSAGLRSRKRSTPVD